MKAPVFRGFRRWLAFADFTLIATTKLRNNLPWSTGSF